MSTTLREEQIMRLTKLEKLGRIRALNNEIEILTKHLKDISFTHKINLSYQQNLILSALVDKYNKNGTVTAYTANQLSLIVYDDPKGYTTTIKKDMELLVSCGYVKEGKVSANNYAYALVLEKFV
jgi:hypothetical protein